MRDEFILWLESHKPKSVRHYSSGFNTIENILTDNNLSSLEEWSLTNYNNNFDELKSLESFNKLNSSGNNILTATLSNLKKFMEQNNNIVTPQLPFDSFGWRWASTGIASHLNKPTSLKIILDALLINGNGSNNYTKSFKELVHKLCLNKYSISEEDSDKLTKLSNPKDEKNIIENSANYWYHLDLLETTGKNAKVSQLGEQFLSGLISNDEFILDRINNYYLPNKAYKNTEISKWQSVNLKIYPFKIIQDIFSYLFKNYRKEEQYLTEEELSNIIIPSSSNLTVFDISKITSHIINYRKYPHKYSSWPKPQSNYTDDKGFRMANEFLYFLEVFGFLTSNKVNNVKSSDKKYKATGKFINMEESKNQRDLIFSVKTGNDEFKIEQFKIASDNSGLKYSTGLITRYVSSLATKPFVLLSGLSGSGKTKLAQSFAQWICENEEQYCIVPVGADWTNREPLLGYVNALNPLEYIIPDNKALQLIIDANNVENQNKPYFLILDEMNLSHVERYFADFLSVMESKDNFKLHSDIKQEKSGVPFELSWPKNLFVVGTVNIDETTYMFSPKVLDRANVIEFRVDETEIKDFLHIAKEVAPIANNGKTMASSFIAIAKEKETKSDFTNLNNLLLEFFKELQVLGSEFGYRTASEIQTLFSKIDKVNPDYSVKENEKIDIAIIQKLLPKLHGSRRKLLKTLNLLASKCLEKEQEYIFNERGEYKVLEDNTIKYKLSFGKIARMYKSAIENGFASYAEA